MPSEEYYDRLTEEIMERVNSLNNPVHFWDYVKNQVGLETKLRLTHSAIFRYRDIHLLNTLIEKYKKEGHT